VEPVFSKAGETIGINYMGMDVTDQVTFFIFSCHSFKSLVNITNATYVPDAQQVRKRERMAKLREEIAVQKAKETELNKTIHITGSIAW
jgi:hypothetical protein